MFGWFGFWKKYKKSIMDKRTIKLIYKNMKDTKKKDYYDKKVFNSNNQG